MKIQETLHAWKKLTSLNSHPVELDRIRLIQSKSPPFLSNEDNVENLLLALGLNDEGLNEYPAHLHPYCGKGLYIWQYPNQFSKYLVYLSQLKISSYIELGVRHGGTFITTVEYLQKFNPLQFAIGVDIIDSCSLKRYSSVNKIARFEKLNTQSEEFVSFIREIDEIDLLFIDSIHEEESCMNEFNVIKDKTRYIAFHDICNENYPGIINVWEKVKQMEPFNYIEFRHQYDRVDGNYMGIGVLIRKKGG